MLERVNLKSPFENLRMSEEMDRMRLGTLANRYDETPFVCNHESSELTSLCPMTELPDFYTIHISYVPGPLLVELKSLKLYLNSFRNRKILHEELANEILHEYVERVKPKRVEICLRVNVRGGVATEITCKWPELPGSVIGDVAGIME